MKKLKNCRGISLIVLIIIVAIILCVTLFFYKKSNNLDVVVTADNYESIKDIFTEKQEDELYYFYYACLYYGMKNIFTKEYISTQDENILYQEIHGKTVQQLVDEGKQLMKDNNITLEEYKQQLQEASN